LKIKNRQSKIPNRLVVIGGSLGSMAVLKSTLAGLPAAFPFPIAVVLHRGKDSTGNLSSLLTAAGALPVVEVEDKDRVTPGRVFLAPADYHLLVDGDRFALSVDAPVHYARPSIDVLFESAAAGWGAALIGIILTGNNKDGAQGLARLKQNGGLAIVQDPSSAEASAMPEAAIAAARPQHIAPIKTIPQLLLQLCGER